MSGLDPVGIGAREPEVEEPVSGAKSIVFEYDVNEVVEPKVLRPFELIRLIEKLGSSQRVAAAIECSEAFVRQSAKGARP